MSRPLKFRAWDKKRKRYAKVIQTTNQGWKGYRDKTYITNGIMRFSKWVLSRFVIEQYTGLKDKNGKEIYEGDIVKAKIQGFWETGPNTICEGKATWNLEVVYDEIRYMDVFHILGSKNAPDRIYYLFDKELSELEVIGNIHENPELMEGEE